MVVMWYFQNSTNMQIAYGFSITVAMLMTTVLMYYYMRYVKKWSLVLVTCTLLVFLSVETSFFVANAIKIVNRLPFLVVEGGIIFTMLIWYRARKINNRFLQFVNLKDYLQTLKDVSADMSLSKFATHLVYLTKANNSRQIEKKVMISIFSHQPKRADVYWLVHVERTDQPYTMNYSVEAIEPDKLIRVEFRLGFRVDTKINLLFKKVVHEMVKNGELDLRSPYPSLEKHDIPADFRFVVLEKFLSYENKVNGLERFVLNSYFGIKHFLALSDAKAFGLDTSETQVEMIPLVVSPISDVHLHRVEVVQKH